MPRKPRQSLREMQDYKKLFLSFFYAFSGIWNTIRSERNLRIHLVCLVYMLSFLLATDWFTLSRGDWALLLLAAALVIAAELFNTAIEATVDLATEERRPLAKKAKDAAAGAVLVCAIFAVVVGLLILLQPEAFRQMFAYFGAHPLSLALFALSIVPATLFIFFGFGKQKKP